jgi:tRNA pseudouridine55 synthase
MFGFLNLNKESDWTSHDCVAKVRKILRTKQVGHGGTLDPLATGVLPIAVGKATRLLPYLPEEKAYIAKIKLGMETDTDDLAGKVINSSPLSHLSLEDIREILPEFQGKISQVPPMYSAIKVEGKKLYELARKGEVIDVPSRQVEIYEINILNWQSGDFPEIELEIECSPGTYIRTIAHDLGRKLNSFGVLTSLIRTKSCGLHISDSITLNELDEGIKSASFSLTSPQKVLTNLSIIYLDNEQEKLWLNGRKITDISVHPTTQSPFIQLCNGDRFLGIGEISHIVNETDQTPVIIPKVVIVDNE